VLGFGLPIGKTDLTFGGDSVPDTDSGSVFLSSHHCEIRDFRRFISISQSVPDFYEACQNDWCRRGNESTTFCERSGRHPDWNPGSLLAETFELTEVCTLSTVCLFM